MKHLTTHAAEQAAMAIYGLAVSNGAVGGIGLLLDILDTVQARLSGSLLARLCSVPALRTALEAMKPEELADEELLLLDSEQAVSSQVFRASRLRFLLTAVPKLQAAHGQLYADEAKELQALVARLDQPQVFEALTAGTAAGDVLDGIARLSTLYEWATPWGRFWRRDREATERMEQYLATLAHSKNMQARDTHAMLVCLKTGVGDAKAKAAAAAHVASQIASLETAKLGLVEHSDTIALELEKLDTQIAALTAKKEMLK